MFEVLMYLFEKYTDNGAILPDDHNVVMNDLQKAGFNSREIDRALKWLKGLIVAKDRAGLPSHYTPLAMRHYSIEECEHISLEGRGFLLYLEQLGILDPVTREVVIDRLMALQIHEVDNARIKWVVLIALFNQPDKKSALNLLQDMILLDAFEILH